MEYEFNFINTPSNVFVRAVPVGDITFTLQQYSKKMTDYTEVRRRNVAASTTSDRVHARSLRMSEGIKCTFVVFEQ